MTDDDFSPCRIGESDGTFSLVFDDFNANDAGKLFEELGFEGGGYGWHAIVDALIRMRAPQFHKKLHYDPEGSMFVVFSKDRAAIRQVAELIRAALADPALLREAIAQADPEILEG